MVFEDIEHVAVIGTGLIGSAWTALFLHHGLSVIAISPAPDAERHLQEQVMAMWPDLVSVRGGESEPDFSRLRFAAEPGPELSHVQFVQENAPENVSLKREIFSTLEKWVSPSVPFASSTSALLMSDIQTACAHPERCLSAHPFNPPHLLPLIELSGGRLTAPEVLAGAADFYEGLGKRPVILKKEIEGHIAGRLSAALFREAVSLVEQGIASVADIDAAVQAGPGLRSAFAGPFLAYHFGGGPGGIAHYLEHLGASQQKRWDSLGTPILTDALKAEIIAGVEAETEGRDFAELTRDRDDLLVAFLTAKTNKHSL